MKIKYNRLVDVSLGKHSSYKQKLDLVFAFEREIRYCAPRDVSQVLLAVVAPSN
jgi:hypothetical protein